MRGSLLLCLSGLVLALAVPRAAPGDPAFPAPAADVVALPTGPAAGTVAPASMRDTVVQVQRGDVFLSRTLQGTLTVRTGADDEVRLSGDRDGEVLLVREGGTLHLRGRRADVEADLVLEVPAWMPFRLRSREMDLSLSGLEAEVQVEVLDGDLRLEGLAGRVDARTVDGEVDARDTRGSLRLFTNDGDVRVMEHRGEVQVETTDGDLILRDVVGPAVSAFTLDGDVEFDGAIEGNGSLELSTHDGDVVVWIPEEIQADVEVSTFDGGFESEFPALTRGFRAGEPLQFRIGDGGVRIALRSFSGDISIHSW